MTADNRTQSLAVTVGPCCQLVLGLLECPDNVCIDHLRYVVPPIIRSLRMAGICAKANLLACSITCKLDRCNQYS